MSRVIFLTDAQDSATSTTYYGKDHQADLTDEVFVQTLLTSGKAALMGTRIRQANVSGISTTGATISWTVDQPCTAMKVDYGTSSAYGSSQAATPASGSGAVTAALTGLTTGTTYHYRISITCNGYVTLSPDLTFRTN